MATKTEKNCEGCTVCDCATLNKNATPLNKTFSEDCCPECGSPDLAYRSRDPCEGDYYKCLKCGCRILFPLNYCRKFIAPVCDADSIQAEIAKSPFPDAKPFDPEACMRDLVGS